MANDKHPDIVELQTRIQAMDKHLERFENSCFKLTTAIFGDGNGHRGLSTRVATTEDRLESMANRQRVILAQNWMIIIAVVSTFVHQVLLN